MAKRYSAADITVLEGLEPVRQRPAMYIGGVGKDGYHHLLTEIVDNAVDEAMNGHATTIEVTLAADQRTVTIEDNGRGIPIDLHPKHKQPALTLILTTLHAGGKFSQDNYVTSGGLHGVGSSVVNALAESMTVTVKRDGHEHTQSFSRGKPLGKLKKGAKAKGTGTRVSFSPDPQIFGPRMSFDSARIAQRLDDLSFVHPGIRFVYSDEKSGTRQTFHQKEGIQALLKRAIGKQNLTRVIDEEFTLKLDGKRGGPFFRLEVTLTWTDARDERFRSYANGVYTVSGGTHENGMRQGILDALKNYMDTHKGLVKKVKPTSDDIREGVIAILSLFVEQPQFQGQTKAKLNNPEVQPAIRAAVGPALEDWLNKHSSLAERIVSQIVTNAEARARSKLAAEEVRKKLKGGRKGTLPDKLANCVSNDPSECELFIVEGDSAGGSAKKGRNSRTQAVLPLRGKVLNAEQASLKKVLDTKELADIVKALGCGIGDAYDGSKLSYHKVILLMDADADGAHITTLLLTFFYRYLPQLIRDHHQYIAKPPLFKVTFGKDRRVYAEDEQALNRILKQQLKLKTDAELRAFMDNGKSSKVQISRFKGLGEMDADNLAETSLDPKSRILERVDVPDQIEADQTLRALLGRDPRSRFDFITEGAGDLDEDEVDV